MEKPFPTDLPVHELLRSRWSPRAFDPDRPVSSAEVATLLEAARIAPSTFNEQPWRFLVFDATDAASRELARGCLTPGNAWARLAPVLFLSVAAERWSKDGTPNRFAAHDVGLATGDLLLQACAMGLAGHPMAGYDAAQARELFGIPEGFTPMAMIAVGHSGDPGALSEPHRERELAPRKRKPMEEIAFAGAWGRPYRPAR